MMAVIQYRIGVMQHKRGGIGEATEVMIYLINFFQEMNACNSFWKELENPEINSHLILHFTIMKYKYIITCPS